MCARSYQATTRFHVVSVSRMCRVMYIGGTYLPAARLRVVAHIIHPVHFVSLNPSDSPTNPPHVAFPPATPTSRPCTDTYVVSTLRWPVHSCTYIIPPFLLQQSKH